MRDFGITQGVEWARFVHPKGSVPSRLPETITAQYRLTRNAYDQNRYRLSTKEALARQVDEIDARKDLSPNVKARLITFTLTNELRGVMDDKAPDFTSHETLYTALAVALEALVSSPQDWAAHALQARIVEGFTSNNNPDGFTFDLDLNATELGQRILAAAEQLTKIDAEYILYTFVNRSPTPIPDQLAKITIERVTNSSQTDEPDEKTPPGQHPWFINW